MLRVAACHSPRPACLPAPVACCLLRRLLAKFFARCDASAKKGDKPQDAACETSLSEQSNTHTHTHFTNTYMTCTHTTCTHIQTCLDSCGVAAPLCLGDQVESRIELQRKRKCSTNAIAMTDMSLITRAPNSSLLPDFIPMLTPLLTLRLTMLLSLS